MSTLPNTKKLLDTLYTELLTKFSPEEIRYLKLKLVDQDASGIEKATFVFVCPNTGGLVHTDGFVAHPHIDEKTKEVSAILTAECPSCSKEHSIVSLSFSELLGYKK